MLASMRGYEISRASKLLRASHNSRFWSLQRGIVEKTYELDLSDLHDRLVADELIRIANSRFAVREAPLLPFVPNFGCTRMYLLLFSVLCYRGMYACLSLLVDCMLLASDPALFNTSPDMNALTRVNASFSQQFSMERNYLSPNQDPTGFHGIGIQCTTMMVMRDSEIFLINVIAVQKTIADQIWVSM